MSTREAIHTEVDAIEDRDLDALYRVVQAFRAERSTEPHGSLLADLREIRIDGPPDFSGNIDLYLSGEKQVETDLR